MVYIAQSVRWGAVEYTNSISAEVRPLPTSVLDMPLNYDGEALVMLELWEMRSTPSLASLPGPL